MKFLKGNDDKKENGFIYDSIVRRVPSILAEMIQSSPDRFSAEDLKRVNKLASDLKEATLTINSADKIPYWTAYEKKHANLYSGMNCLEAPWWFIENYIYHMLLVELGYFDIQSSWSNQDPFLFLKLDPQVQGLKALSDLLKTFPTLTSFVNEKQQRYPLINSALLLSCWGNRIDLSVLSGKASSEAHKSAMDANDTILIADDRHKFVDHIQANIGKKNKIIIILDNCGLELYHDILLCDQLLQHFEKLSVVFHAKLRPVFVSDATPIDVERHIESLKETESTMKLYDRIQHYVKSGRFSVTCHSFYNSPLAYHEAPTELRDSYKEALAVISKGDANYRRLLGDLHWNNYTPFQEAVGSYFPTALLALRTCKSPIIVGVTKEGIEAAKKLSADKWCLTGKTGVIQFCYPVKNLSKL